MPKLTVRWKLAAPADAVWALVGDFHGTPKVNAEVAASVPARRGRVRRLVMKDGSEFVERLIERDDKARRLAYEIIDTVNLALPFEHYDGVYRVVEDEPGRTCIFEITGNYEGGTITQAEIEQDIRGFYEPYMEGVKKALGLLP